MLLHHHSSLILVTKDSAVPVFEQTKILHTLVGEGSAALAAAVYSLNAQVKATELPARN